MRERWIISIGNLRAPIAAFGTVADGDQMLTMRAIQERRDPAAAASEFPQTRQQPWTLVLRRGGGVTGAAVRRLRQTSAGHNSGAGDDLCGGITPVVFNPETDAIVGMAPNVTSFRVADGVGDDLGDAVGFLVGAEVAGAVDRDQVRTRTGLKRSALVFGQAAVALLRMDDPCRHSGVAGTLGGRLVSTEVFQVGMQSAAKDPRVGESPVGCSPGRRRGCRSARRGRNCESSGCRRASAPRWWKIARPPAEDPRCSSSLVCG